MHGFIILPCTISGHFFFFTFFPPLASREPGGGFNSQFCQNLSVMLENTQHTAQLTLELTVCLWKTAYLQLIY